MPMDGGFPNFFTINGKSYPATETIKMKVGQLLKIRFVGSNTTAIHPMHIHGGPFQVAAVDGATLPQNARYTADTINVGPGRGLTFCGGRFGLASGCCIATSRITRRTTMLRRRAAAG